MSVQDHYIASSADEERIHTVNRQINNVLREHSDSDVANSDHIIAAKTTGETIKKLQRAQQIQHVNHIGEALVSSAGMGLMHAAQARTAIKIGGVIIEKTSGHLEYYINHVVNHGQQR